MNPPHRRRRRQLAAACLLLGLVLALSALADGDGHRAGTLLLVWAGASVSMHGCARRSRMRHTSSTES